MLLSRKSARFFLENWIQRGTWFQILFVGALIVAIAVGGGVAAHAATDGFERLSHAIWWSFLRLTDPGYLGDDEGLALRVISTTVTVLGYVLFMGSLIAIMTQWLSRTLRRLESGLTPISMSGHVVILGWTNRTPEIVKQLFGARGRLQRFLHENRLRRLRVVVLTDEVDAQRRADLRDHVGELWNERQVFLRSGSSLEPEHLERLDLQNAAVIVVPGADFELGGAELTDTRVVKTLLSVRRILQEMPEAARPLVVAEILDSQKVEVARSAFEGRLEVIAGDAVVSRLISQSVRHRRLAHVFVELLSSTDGSSLYVRGFPEFAGENPTALNPHFPDAIVVGVVRMEGHRRVTHLIPRGRFELQPDDLLILVARRFDETTPRRARAAAPPPPATGEPDRLADRTHRLLLLAWGHKTTSILAELASSAHERFEVTLVTRMPVAEQQRALASLELDPERVRVNHVEADYATVGVLERLRAHEYDGVVFLPSAGMGSSEEADARTVLGYVLLRALVGAHPETRPEILIELLDPMNKKLFEDSEDVQFVSPQILSHLLAHVSLRPELNSVYEALFVAGGVEVSLRHPGRFGVTGRPVTFAEIEAVALAAGEVALGLLLGRSLDGERLYLNPDRTRTWTLAEDDEVVVVADSEAS